MITEMFGTSGFNKDYYEDMGNCCLLAINHFVIAINIVMITGVLKAHYRGT